MMRNVLGRERMKKGKGSTIKGQVSRKEDNTKKGKIKVAWRRGVDRQVVEKGSYQRCR